MRENLFHGKRVDNGEWVEGYYFCDTDLEQSYIQGYDYYTGENGLQREAFCYEVIPETVGQYTGLTDKIGKKIFEGDVLRRAYHPEEDVVIEWFDGSFMFKEVHNPNDDEYSILCCVQNAVSHLKVIGNIYDNPELIGGRTNE